MIRISNSVSVNEQSGVAEARRVAVSCAEALRMNETAVGKTALAATELTTNLVKHGTGGALLIGSEGDAMVLVAIDKGDGIAHLERAMSDGYSTAGSAGQGLGAIRRASSFFDLYSMPEAGTAVMAVIGGSMSTAHSIEIAGVCIPIAGETEAGDGWVAIRDGEGVTITVADGLGHGIAAAEAANGALRVARERASVPIDEMLRDMHAALRSTRGAAVSIARIDAAAMKIEFAGVGNVGGAVIDDQQIRRMVSQPGIVGHELRKVQIFTYPWSASATVIMQSDGIGTAWNVDHYPGLLHHTAAVAASVIYRDYCRGTDDATVVVARGLS